MFSLIDLIARHFPSRPLPDTPRRLMESAGARAGTDARQARELREAACAYLRVVR
jgi:hypothetical protein